MSKEKIKVYLYTRVSTTMQIDGYSLDAQKTKMKAFCDYNEYEIAGEYEDAGKSGKSIEGRIAFNQMMDDIKSGKDEVSYVLVFKLSRFGRNAADGCKHRNMTRGHKCGYKKQVHEEMLDASVAEVISKLVSNPKFSDLMCSKINMEVDTSALDQEIANYEKQLRHLYHNKDTILSDIDFLDYEDKHYQRRKTDLENRLYKTYDKIEEAEELLISAKTQKRALLADKITGDNIYKALIFFDKLYAQMNEAEKREFLSQLVDNVQIYEERKENGQWLKSIEFKLPIIEKEFTLSLDNDTQNETVCLLSKGIIDSQKVKVEMSLADMDMSRFKKGATYEAIKDYVKEQTGYKVSSLYIAQVKAKHGLDMRENFNLPKSEDARQPKCPAEKEKAIEDALRHFQMI